MNRPPVRPESPSVRVACRLEAQLGEGPAWFEREQALWFVDIKGGCLYRFDPLTGEGEKHDVGGKPSFIVPAEDGGMIVGAGHCLHRFDGVKLGEVLARIDMPDHNRTNDATVDAQGHLWFGTMDEREKDRSGLLYRYDGRTVDETSWRAVVTNGPAICGSGNWLYHVDSGERIVWRIPLLDGRIADKGEVFVQLSGDEGSPDGVVIDSENCLWVALWDGWGVRRYGPDGALLLEVLLPCSRVTKVAFGGPGLRTAYVTTARTGLDEAALAEQPLAGSLFAFEAPAPGRCLPAVRLSR